MGVKWNARRVRRTHLPNDFDLARKSRLHRDCSCSNPPKGLPSELRWRHRASTQPACSHFTLFPKKLSRMRNEAESSGSLKYSEFPQAYCALASVSLGSALRYLLDCRTRRCGIPALGSVYGIHRRAKPYTCREKPYKPDVVLCPVDISP